MSQQFHNNQGFFTSFRMTGKILGQPLFLRHKMTKRLLIGLTGGIASGKSAAAEYLRKLGAFVISADMIGKEVMTEESGMPGWVRETFGSEFFDSEGRLMRKNLGDLVFSDPEKKKLLDDKIFPIIYRALRAKIDDGFRVNNLVVVDAAMIFEWGIEDDFDIILTVVSSWKNVRERLACRDGFDTAQIENRIASQIDNLVKAEKSDYVIENNSSLEKLEEEILGFYNFIIVE